MHNKFTLKYFTVGFLFIISILAGSAALFYSAGYGINYITQNFFGVIINKNQTFFTVSYDGLTLCGLIFLSTIFIYGFYHLAKKTLVLISFIGFEFVQKYQKHQKLLFKNSIFQH